MFQPGSYLARRPSVGPAQQTRDRTACYFTARMSRGLMFGSSASNLTDLAEDSRDLAVQVRLPTIPPVQRVEDAAVVSADPEGVPGHRSRFGRRQLPALPCGKSASLVALPRLGLEQRQRSSPVDSHRGCPPVARGPGGQVSDRTLAPPLLTKGAAARLTGPAAPTDRPSPENRSRLVDHLPGRLRVSHLGAATDRGREPSGLFHARRPPCGEAVGFLVRLWPAWPFTQSNRTCRPVTAASRASRSRR